jgi:hypothetical protein
MPASPDGPGGTRGPAEVIAGPADGHDSAAAALNDMVAGPLVAAGLALEAALALLGDHPATQKVHEALSELDIAIRSVRTAVFDHRRPDPPSGGRPEQGRRKPSRA